MAADQSPGDRLRPGRPRAAQRHPAFLSSRPGRRGDPPVHGSQRRVARRCRRPQATGQGVAPSARGLAVAARPGVSRSVRADLENCMPGFDPNDLGGLMAGFQQQMQRLQEEAAATEVTGAAGGGMVQVVANGAQEVLRIAIQDNALEDRELLEDLLVAATNDALRQGKEVMANKVGSLTAGLPLPPGLLG